jgi:hypothetical protein
MVLRVSRRWKRRLLHAGQAGVLAALYFAAAKASLLLAIPPGYATAIWPPAREQSDRTDADPPVPSVHPRSRQGLVLPE